MAALDAAGIEGAAVSAVAALASPRCNASRKVKILPPAGGDIRSMAPPMAVANCLLIYSPNPAPDVEGSALPLRARPNNRKMRSMSAPAMPGPVSRTDKAIAVRRFASSGLPAPFNSAVTVTQPRSVNFTALLSRLFRICISLRESPHHAPANAGSMRQCNCRPFCAARAPNAFTVDSMVWQRSNSRCAICNASLSLRVKSSVLFSTSFRVRAEHDIAAANCACASSSRVLPINSIDASMP